MLDIKRLLEINAELREFYKEGVIDTSIYGDASVHMTEGAFDELIKNMTTGHEENSSKYIKRSVRIEGVEFFCLEERKRHED